MPETLRVYHEAKGSGFARVGKEILHQPPMLCTCLPICKARFGTCEGRAQKHLATSSSDAEVRGSLTAPSRPCRPSDLVQEGLCLVLSLLATCMGSSYQQAAVLKTLGSSPLMVRIWARNMPNKHPPYPVRAIRFLRPLIYPYFGPNMEL